MNPSTIEGASERFECKAEVVKADGSIQSYVTEAATASNAAGEPLSRVLEKAILPPWMRPFQTFRSVLQTAGALLPPIGQSLTIIIGNPRTHPRSIYARHRRQSTAPYSPAFHVLTPDPASHSGSTGALGATASAVSLHPIYQSVVMDTTKVESPPAPPISHPQSPQRKIS